MTHWVRGQVDDTRRPVHRALDVPGRLAKGFRDPRNRTRVLRKGRRELGSHKGGGDAPHHRHGDHPEDGVERATRCYSKLNPDWRTRNCRTFGSVSASQSAWDGRVAAF